MVQSSDENSVLVFNQRKVSLVENCLLVLLAVVKCNLFSVLNQTSVFESELSFQGCLGGGVSAKGRCERSHDDGGALDQETYQKHAFSSKVSRQRPRVEEHVERGLCEVRVEMGNGGESR